MIGKRGECDIALERGPFAQLGRNEDAALLIDDDFVRTADEEQLEGANLAMEARALANLILEPRPFIWRIGLEASMSLEHEIGDIKSVMAVAIEFLAEAHRETDASLVVDSVIVAAGEHWELSWELSP